MFVFAIPCIPVLQLIFISDVRWTPACTWLLSCQSRLFHWYIWPTDRFIKLCFLDKDKHPHIQVCHGFRLIQLDGYFQADFDHFRIEHLFWGSWGSSENWHKPKTKPPLANLDCLNITIQNLTQTLYKQLLYQYYFAKKLQSQTVSA